MGIVFDKNMARQYNAWYHSPQGRAIEKALKGLFTVLVDPQPMEKVLDIGCGSGNHLLLLNTMGLDVSGIDPSADMIEEARQRLGHSCLLKTGIAEDLPFDDNEFDVVVFINTLEFLSDPASALREAGRVAKRKVFICVMNSMSLNGVYNKIRSCLSDTFFSHGRFYNLWQVKALLKKVYGDCPVSWGCARTSLSLCKRLMHSNHFDIEGQYKTRACFGTLLGVAVSMKYWIKTDMEPLKLDLKKGNQNLIDASVCSTH